MSKKKEPRVFPQTIEDPPSLSLPEDDDSSLEELRHNLENARRAELLAADLDDVLPRSEPLPPKAEPILLIPADTSNRFLVGSAVAGIMLRRVLGPNIALSDEDCLNLAAHLLHRSNAVPAVLLEYWKAVAKDNPPK